MAARPSPLPPDLQAPDLPATWGTTAFVALAVLAVSLVGLAHPLQNLNEGLYARIPVEMLASRDFVIPTLNGVPYLEKPPLLYWVTALAYSLFGVSEAAARVAPLLGALLTFGAVEWFARRRLAPHADAYALAMLLGAPIVVVMARTLLFDMLLTGLLSWSLVTLAEALQRSSDRRHMRASAIALALAVLTKGLAPLVFYGTIGLLLVPARDGSAMRARLRTLFAPDAFALFLAVAAPWHVAAALREPAFAHFYFINEHVLRFLDRRVPHDYHTGPWWFYLQWVPTSLLPWSPLLLAPFVWRRSAASGADTRRFLLAWFLVPLVVFSLSKAKAPYYMLIGVPPLALLLGDALARRSGGRWPLALVSAGWLLILAGVLTADPSRLAPYVEPPALAPVVALASGLATAALLSALRRQPLVSAALLGSLALPAAYLFSQSLQSNEAQRSARPVAREVARHPRPVYVYRDFEAASTLPWYLGHDVGIVDSRSADLWFGRRLHPRSGDYPDLERFVAAAAAAPLWLVVARDRRPEFEATPLPSEFVLVARHGRFLLFASRPLMAELGPRRDGAIVAREVPAPR